MAIKIKGSTIINDDRVLENADKIGIGTTNPHVALEIFGKVGIGTTNPDAAIGTQNNTKLAVAGIVTAYEYYGTFKGDVVPETAADRIEKGDTKAQVVDDGTNGHFLVETEGTERLRIDVKGNVGVGTTIPLARIHICNVPNIPYADTRLRLTQVDASANNRHWEFSANIPEILRLQAIDDSNSNDGHGSGGGNHFDFYRDGNDINEFRGVGIGENWFVVDNKNFNVGIGTTNPTGSNAVSTANTSVLAVGIVTAREYYGTFKGTIQSAVADDRIEKGNTKAQVVDDGTNGHFLVETEGTERLRVDKDGNISFDLPTTVSNQVAITRSSILKNTTAATPRDDFYIDGDLKPISQIASTWNAYHSITRHDAGYRFGPYLMLAKNRNNAYNSNTIVQDNDEFGNIAFFGNDGTKFREGARIRGVVDGTPALNQMPGALTFWTNNGIGMLEKVRITSDGDVGIGTDDPLTNKATVDNTATLAVGIITAREYHGTFKGTIDPAVADDKIQKGNTKAQVVDNGPDGHFLVETEGVEKLRITGIGSVGIGTTSPEHKLDVVDSGQVSIKLETTATGNLDDTIYRSRIGGNTASNYFYFGDVDDTNAGQIRYHHNDNSLQIFVNTNPNITGSGERVRITNAGDVGIGTTNPTAVVTSSNTATLAVGIVTAHEFRGGTFYGTIDSTVNSISLNTNLEDVFSVLGNQLSGDDAGADKIVFWDDDTGESGGKLTYLSVDGTTIEIDDTTLKVKADAVGKNYDLDFEGTDGGSGVGIATWTLSDGTNDDSVTLKAGSNISISNVGTSEFTIQAVQGAGVGVAASASDVLNVNGGLIGGVNPGLTTDVIVYWHEDATYTGGTGKLDHLQIGTGLKIENDELKIDSSVVGKSYTLPVTVEEGTSGSGGNSGIATLTLTDDVTPDPGEDPVTIEAGDGIVIKSITGGEGFEISADISGGGGGGISDVQVIQYSDNADPRTERTSTNPIDVQKSVGIVTIGIGTTSNAYGNRFVGPNRPLGAIEGDIWYDTTTTGQGTNRVAVIKHIESTGTSGGAAPNQTSFNTRKLNDLKDPNGMGVTLNTNIFSLPAGTYKIDFSTPFYHTGYSQSRLKYSNQTDVVSGTLSYIIGSSLYAGPGSGGETVGESDGHGIITLTETNYFILESRVSNAQGVSDYGIRCTYSDEVYSQIRIEDLATAVKDDGNTNRIIQGNTKAEVNDTGSDGHFLVETEGSERLRIIKDGSALFGGLTTQHTSDTSNLAVKSVNSNIEIIKVHSDGGEIDGDLAGISFSHGGHLSPGNSTEAARAKAAIAFESRGGTSFGYGRGDLCFYVDNASDDNQVSATDEKLRITMDGDVGIGTTNPTGSNALTNNNTTLAVGTIKANNISGNPNFSIGSDEQIIFNNGSSLAGDDKFVFDHVDKKVGIGTTNPYYRLHAFFNNSTTSFTGGSNGNWGGDGIRIENNNNTIGAMSLFQFRVDNADWHIGNKKITGSNPDGNSDFVFNAEGSEKLRITSAGDVGIGTTNPTGANAVGSGNTSVLAVGVVTCRELYVNGNNISDGGANVSIDVSPPSSANAGDLWWDSDNGDLHVYYKDTDNTEQWVSVNSDGSSSASTPLSSRNLVYNGKMSIAQRITSGGAVTSTMGYHIDRWKALSFNTGSTVTQAQYGVSTTDPIYEKGFNYYFKFKLSAAGTVNTNTYLEVQQLLEGQDIDNSGWNYRSSSSYITLSFWFRASTNQTFYGFLRTFDGTSSIYPFSFTASGNNTWTKITKTIPGNSNLTIYNNHQKGLQISLVPFYGTNYTNNNNLNNWTTLDATNAFPDMASTWFTAGASEFDLTGVQLELGKTATPFEHRTLQDDLARCRRYFLKIASGAFLFPSPNVYTSMRFPQQMRTPPSLTFTGTGTQNGVLSTIDGFRASNNLGPQDFAVTANAELDP